MLTKPAIAALTAALTLSTAAQAKVQAGETVPLKWTTTVCRTQEAFQQAQAMTGGGQAANSKACRTLVKGAMVKVLSVDPDAIDPAKLLVSGSIWYADSNEIRQAK
jgi:hypothetical protein